MGANKQVSYSPELVKKAEGGDADAQSRLGACYFFGHGVAKDQKKAVKWWLKSAGQTNAWGMFYLTRCYYFGTGVDKDEKMASSWAAKSAEHGDDWANDIHVNIDSKTKQ